MTIEELYKIYLANPNITTDSRNCPEHSIFFGIKGENFDGSLYADQALCNGAAYAVMTPQTPPPTPLRGRLIPVNSPLETLQLLANYHIRQMKAKGLKVIAITGTNGKTTTKELVSAVLQRKYRTLCTQGNFNNHLGVPLTILRIRPEHEIAVIEMGANHPGEIKTLCSIAEPEYGLITSVGRAHLEGFGSFEGVIKTKCELYDFLREHGGKVFLNESNEHLVPMAKGIESIPYIKGEVLECNPFVKFSVSGDSIAAQILPQQTAATTVDGVCQTRLIGDYNIVNLLAAATVGNYFAVPSEEILEALAAYTPTNNRSQLMETSRNTLIVDAYNANPTSMSAALDNFLTIKSDKPKMLILGGMAELGPTSQEEHDRIKQKIANAGIKEHTEKGDSVWYVGKQWGDYTFENVDEVIAELHKNPLYSRLILIKGSNSQKLFKLPELL